MISDSVNVIERLQRLRRFEGPPPRFWSELGSALAELSGALAASILTQPPGDSARWLSLGATAPVPADAAAIAFAAAESAAREGVSDRAGAVFRFAAVALRTGDATRPCVVLLQFPSDFEASKLRAALRAVQLAADIPESYQSVRQLSRAQHDLTGFANALDVLTLLRGRERFLEAAFALCNELATQQGCTQVGLGWLDGRYARLQALSHREDFAKRMEPVQRIEAAMEEAIDQDDELVWPASDAGRVTRDLERCATALGAKHVAVVPLRLSGRMLGALWFQRDAAAITIEDLRAWRVVADQVSEPLHLLRQRDRWWGARWKTEVEEWMRRRWSLEHPWPKVGGVLAALVLSGSLVLPTTYRVEAPFLLRPHDQALLGAAFDGYVKSAAVAPGDRVAEGQSLFALDDAPLRLQEGSLKADVSRFHAEAERARGEGRMAEMRIAQAQEQQSTADLELVRHELSAATVRAPFAGIVLDDGDLRERLGAPVKRGDVLMKLARADRLYAELNVPERDVDEIAARHRVEIAFASRPDLTFAATVERIEPIAVAKEGGGVFIVRATTTAPLPDWVRPGMTGLAKVAGGRHTWFWIATHRAIDWLRLKLWW